jgi:hypothetical protein
MDGEEVEKDAVEVAVRVEDAAGVERRGPLLVGVVVEGVALLREGEILVAEALVGAVIRVKARLVIPLPRRWEDRVVESDVDAMRKVDVVVCPFVLVRGRRDGSRRLK